MIATRARNLWMIAAAATLLATASGRAAALCVGDCNGNNAVVINELLTGVGVSLGDRDVASCRNFDPDDDERVNVNELVQGVNSAINGCPPIDAGLAAFSTSNHYVDVHFPAPVGVEAVDPGNYSIKATDNSPLAVHAARATADPTVITLITDGQDAVRYRLTYAPTSDVAPFDGSTLGEGRLVRARALDNTHVLLTFDVDLYDDAAPPEPGSPSGGAALDRASYRIANPDLNVAAAVFPDGGSEAKRAIILTTAGQSALQYTLVAAGVVDADGRHLDPDSLSAQFDGIAVDDHVAPRLTDVVPAGAQIIVLTFSEPLAPTAADPRLFSITPSVEVTGAQLTNHGTQVVLSTGPQISGQTYTITVAGVRDQAGNLIDPNARQMTFPSSGPTVEPDELPRVVGAVSTSNLTVVVHFSESMSAAALDPTHYSVELEPDVGVLTLVSRCVAGEHVGQLCGSPGFTLHVCEGGVHPGRLCQSDIDCGMGTCGTSCSGSDCQGARFLDANHTQVEIQTISQNDGIYTLTAAGVTDAAGHPLAPRHVVAGAVIDPTSATFAGIGPFTNGMIPDNAGVDSDGDGMPDTDEQAGWDVTVTLLNGDRATQHVTANPLFPDTDNDGLVDPLEFAIGTNPRSNDTDGEGLQDAEEYNVVYSDPTKQDTDDDGISDNLEVELFKTNAILADSDGDGYSDGQELFEMNRDPRIADVPRTRISVASEQLRIDERFTYTDENGDTQTSNSSTTTSLQNASASGTGSHKEDGKDIFFSITGGVEDCQSDCTSGVIFGGGGLLARLKLEATAGANFTHLESTDTSSTTEALNAFDQSLEKGREISASHAVTREVVGAQFDAEVTLQNTSDVAFALSNVEITVQTSDPQNPTRLASVATLLPSSALAGNAAIFTIGPNDSRGPVLFSNREIFPNLVEDLMRAPRTYVFTVANYDLATEDGRNFAFGLQTVRDRTAELAIDFGDGELRSRRVITAGVLNRPREQGGTIIGGFEGFSGTGTPRGIPLDFALQDILHMRKSHPPVIVAGPNMVGDSTPAGDDIALSSAGGTEHAPVIAPGRNGVLDTTPAGDDVIAAEIVAGSDGIADTQAQGDDIQLLPVGSRELAPDAAVIDPGANGLLDTSPSGDDAFHASPPDGILAGPDRSVRSIAEGDDVQLVPAGTDGVPSDALVIGAGENGVLDTQPSGDDVAEVVTGYEVSRTCNAAATAAILPGPDGMTDAVRGGDDVIAAEIVAGPDGVADTQAEGDDIQLLPVGSGGHASDAVVIALGPDGLLDSAPSGDDALHAVAADGILAGPNGLIDSTPRGDDILLGPGTPCIVDSECAGGACTGPEQVVRVERRRRGQFRRQWVLLMPDDTQLQTDFGRIRLRAGQTLGLAFVQDLDRDGLTLTQEALHNSSDFTQDTDDDGIDDFAEVRVGWDVGVVGQAIHHVFSDPSRADSDGDGLTDLEESDLRRLGVDTYEEDPMAAFSTDPRLRDTDADGVGDKQEVFGYLTGAGIVDAFPAVIIAGNDKDADTVACPMSRCHNQTCLRDAECLSGVCLDGRCHCADNGDCLDRQCDQQSQCDDVQVVQRGTRVTVGRTVVIAAGPNGALETDPKPGDQKDSSDSFTGSTFAVGDDIPVVDAGQAVKTATGKCLDGSAFPMCAVVKPGPDGEFFSIPGIDDVLAFGQAIEATNPLNADTDFDEVRDGIEQMLGSSPSDPTDTGVFGDGDADGLTDNQESGLGWHVTVFNAAGHCAGNAAVPCYRAGDCGSGGSCTGADTSKSRDVFSNSNVADTDGDGLPDYAERHLPCFAPPTCDQHKCSNNSLACATNADCANECPTDPTSDDSDGDGLSDYDELSADQLTELKRFNDFFTGFRLDDSGSKHYGTDPTRVDTDGDGLSDGFELLVGWSVRVVDSGGAQRVLSDPTRYDTDSDGLSDRGECGLVDPTAPLALQCKGLPGASGPTNPLDADTDGDKRQDGRECSETSCMTDPLLSQSSLGITVSFTSLRVDTPKEAHDYVFEMNIQKPGQAYPGEPVVTQLTPDMLARAYATPHDYPALDKLFTSSDCVSGGAAPGKLAVVKPFDTTGTFACGLTSGRELSLAHRSRCARDPSGIRAVCNNYPLRMFGDAQVSDACGVLCNGEITGCESFSQGPSLCKQDFVPCDCADSEEPRQETFTIRNDEGFVVNGFVSGVKTAQPSQCVYSYGVANGRTCSKDSDCLHCQGSSNACTTNADCGSFTFCVGGGSGSCNARPQSVVCEMSFAKEYNFQSLRPGFSFETFDLVSADGTCSGKVFAEIIVQ